MGPLGEPYHFLGVRLAYVMDRFIRVGIAHCLRGQPVLTEPTVIITAEHPERQRVAARVDVKEWFLLDGIALQRRHISPWHLELPAFIEPHLADAALALPYLAAVSAGIAFDRIIVQLSIQLPPHR